jgi:acyl-CoA synthetase (AMP-forming)/AMP-acid ligase II
VCFGVADDKYGEVVSAAVTLQGEARSRELIEHCRERLAAFKVPVKIHVLDEIPRTATGKIQRRRVGEFIAEKAGARAGGAGAGGAGAGGAG